MNVTKVNLETVCGITSKLPENLLPEFAFAGKSNVGKSSLINGLMNRKSYARTSSQPGKTQTINFYNINEQLYFVDLPGYGYAKVSMELRAKWGKMIERYLKKSLQLKLIFLLVDIRHEPSENDRDMYDWIVHNGFQPIVIATKLDKINRSQIAKQSKLIRTSLKMPKEGILIPFSAETKQGRDEIWQKIEALLPENETNHEKSIAEEGE
ncbi:MAG: YihA family ribosome biogenesis GTP-binding protein [Lachnospiraceae bacterium]|nr:YihA family ribosome biogenesis GTP-binding protein [Lachnospiraceae bacterium]